MSSTAQALTTPRASLALLARDYAELIKARITVLIMLTAWSGFYFGSLKSGVSSLSWTLPQSLLGIGLAAAGTAALNEAMERDLDARMRRTALRPLVTGRMSLAHAVILGFLMVLGGVGYLWFVTNLLAAALTLATSVVYLAAYTPLKQVHPLCTFIGAFPGAMPPVLGWAAARGHLNAETLLLFAIVFFWQFPHFHSIAWLYREDYERAGIRMLPVVESDGRSTARSIILYLVALLLVTMVPPLFGMATWRYLVGAALLGAGFFWLGWRLAASGLTPLAPESRRLARHVLQASVLYLPLLFALMMADSKV